MGGTDQDKLGRVDLTYPIFYWRPFKVAYSALRETLVSRPSLSVSKIICELHALACSAYCWHVFPISFYSRLGSHHLVEVVEVLEQKLNKYDPTILYSVKTQTSRGWYFKWIKFKEDSQIKSYKVNATWIQHHSKSLGPQGGLLRTKSKSSCYKSNDYFST